MEASILNSTKRILSIDDGYTAFDHDICTFINGAISTLHQLGLGPDDGFVVEDSSQTWEELGLTTRQLNLARTYVYLKVRLLFDPPTTSFMKDAMEEQLKEYEYRLNHSREELIPVPAPDPELEIIDV